MSEAKVSATTATQSVASVCGGVVLRRGPRELRANNPPTPVSRDAQRVAAVILEVLAGMRTPTEAAAVVGMSVPRYYLWEQRALEGLVRACEPRPKGQVVSQRHQIALLEKEVTRLRQDCIRQQALVRASQRTIGLAAFPPPAAKPAAKPSGKVVAKAGSTVAGKAKRKRRPVARALKAVAALQAAPSHDHDHEYMVPDMVPETLADSSSAIAAEVVQQSVPSSSSASAEAASAADHANMVPAVSEA
jgi:hypothetical protein